MQILSKIDRFAQVPPLYFRGYLFASTFVGAMLSICMMILLAVVFGFLVSSSVGNPTSTSVISQSYIDKLDLVPGNFSFCIADFTNLTIDGNGNAYSETEPLLKQLFEQDLDAKVQVYTLSDTSTRTNKRVKYCPDRSATPIAHCICLNEESVEISPSDTFYAKINFDGFPNNLNFDFFVAVPIKTLIPKKLTDPFITRLKTYHLPDIYRPLKGSLSISLDRLVYKVDNNYFVATPKTSYSVLPKAIIGKLDAADVSQRLQGWSLSFTGQTITSETTATKILSILAQVGALNGVFVIVFTVLFLPFFKLKYAENLLTHINKQSKPTENNSKSNKPQAKSPDLSPEDIELQENSPKKRVEVLVRQKLMSKKPLYIGFWEWLCPSAKRASKVKPLQETDLALKKYSDIAKVVRVKMDIDLMKKVLFSPEQLQLLENISFESFALGQNNQNQNGRETTEKPDLDLSELIRSHLSNQDMQSRFVELMKKYYD